MCKEMRNVGRLHMVAGTPESQAGQMGIWGRDAGGKLGCGE